MRARTLILFVVALTLAGGTAMLVRSFLAQRPEVEAEALAKPATPQRSVLVARGAITRGQILKPQDFSWQVWPDGGIDKNYILNGTGGTRTPESFAGWVARDPFAAGEPINDAKMVSPGSRGFLAAVLGPGMRAVSVPVTATSGISGFVFPGDRVDILITHQLTGANNNEARHQAAETVLHDVRVIGIDQKLDSKTGEALVAHTATLEVTPKQSEMIAVAAEIGKLSLSLRSLATPSDEKTLADASAADTQATYTMDSEVSPLVPKPGVGAEGVTILRGGAGKSG
jgi:pilus assembly protein CpaB